MDPYTKVVICAAVGVVCLVHARHTAVGLFFAIVGLVGAALLLLQLKGVL